MALAPVATKGGVILAADVVDSKGALSPCATYQMRGALVTGLVLSAMNGGADTVTEEVELRYTDIAVQHDPSGQKFTDTFL